MADVMIMISGPLFSSAKPGGNSVGDSMAAVYENDGYKSSIGEAKSGRWTKTDGFQSRETGDMSSSSCLYQCLPGWR